MDDIAANTKALFLATNGNQAKFNYFKQVGCTGAKKVMAAVPLL